MKILLDECITKHLKPHLSDYEVATVREMRWSGIKNGKLMALCVEHGFDILLTIDKNLQYQQNLHKYPLTIVVLNSVTSKEEELIVFLPAFRMQLPDFQKHKTYLLDK
jgi:predicted nuclease of predicted toxin-antitoxin system